MKENSKSTNSILYQKKPKVIVGIDPGTIVTGYGVISVTDSSIQTLDYGCIRPPPQLKLSDRYLIIYESLCELLEKYQAEVLAVEAQFVQKNPRSALKLGMSCGIAILAAKSKKIPVFEYAPLKAKQAVVGNGRASKQQVQKVIQWRLNLAAPPTPPDAADALAIALCHAQANPLSPSYKEI